MVIDGRSCHCPTLKRQNRQRWFRMGTGVVCYNAFSFISRYAEYVTI